MILKRPSIAAACVWLCLAPALTSCADPDWRARETAKAENLIRAQVGDPNAAFSHTEVTGNEATGQICGYVKPKSGMPVRFIVYIDNGGGPFVEGGEGKVAMDQRDFNFSWGADCVGEGYTGQ